MELADEEIAKGSAELMLLQTGDAWLLYNKLGCARAFPKRRTCRREEGFEVCRTRGCC
eukprot:COSAG02_NODE_59015_length_275_cov_1.113636_1_plen_57_part_10